MKQRLTFFLALLIASTAASCSGSPTSPSDLEPSATLGTVTIEVISATYWRDFMPVVQNPGPDGGSPLMASIRLRLTNEGLPALLTFSGAILDSGNASHTLSATAVDRQTGSAWDGTVPGESAIEIDVSFRDGPYLAVGSRVSAVVTFEDAFRRSASVRAPEAGILATA